MQFAFLTSAAFYSKPSTISHKYHSTPLSLPASRVESGEVRGILRGPSWCQVGESNMESKVGVKPSRFFTPSLLLNSSCFHLCFLDLKRAVHLLLALRNTMASQPVSQTQPDNTSSTATANPRWPTMVDGKRKTKKRVRNFTPADRAAHRVFEKSRREAFNDHLMVS